MNVQEIARIGMVNFINTALLYETWKETVFHHEWQVVEANPAELNQKLSAGELDLGFISSHEYAVHPEKYRLLPGLSISSSGPVGSVFLFSDEPPENLDKKIVYLSRQSQTSNSLVKIILEEFIGVRPSYTFSLSLGMPDKEETTLLAIGDRALRIQASGRYKFVVDLGEIWQRFSGLPFVFAVWAVRDDYCSGHNMQIQNIHKELLRCVREGKENMARICQSVAPRIPMSVKKCHEYLDGIEYDLEEKKIQALELFYTYLIGRGEGTAEALPLRFVTV